MTSGRRLIAALLLLVGVAAARPAQADWRRWFQFEDLHATYELLGGYQYESYQFPKGGLPDMVRQSVLIGERLGAFVDGSIFHPKFWKYSLQLNLLLLQQWTMDNLGNSGWGHKEDAEFVFDTRLLSDHPYPIHVFARRHTDILRRDFSGNQTVTTSTFGGDLSWQNKVLPMRLSIMRMYNQFGEGVATPGDDAYTQGNFEVRREAARDSGSFEYRLFQYSNNLLPGLDYMAHEFTLQHVWYPGDSPTRKYRIDSRARYNLRYADTDRDDGQLQESLTIHWLPELDSRVTYQFSTSHATGFRGYTHALSLDLRYRLWESLFVGAQGQVSTMASSGGASSDSRWDLSAGVDATYRKKIMDWMVMSHTYQFMGTRQLGGQGSWQDVFDEPAVFQGFEPVILKEAGAIAGSITVLDASTQAQYVLGADYEVRQEGDRVLVVRSAGSKVPDGGAVLISYRYDTGGDDLRSIDHRYVARLRTTFSRYRAPRYASRSTASRDTSAAAPSSRSRP